MFALIALAAQDGSLSGLIGFAAFAVLAGGVLMWLAFSPVKHDRNETDHTNDDQDRT